MFTSITEITNQLEKEGWCDIRLEYINKGVMTDTYKMYTELDEYVVRCYPSFRDWLAEVEYSYLLDFARKGVKAPTPVCIGRSENKVSYLIYKWVKGETFADKLESLTSLQVRTICNEVIANYDKISSIRVCKYGEENNKCSSWKSFLEKEIEKSKIYFIQKNNIHYAKVCNGLLNFVENIDEPQPFLVWSDFSFDNIIISEDNHLAAFIDFEGIISGDPLLGIGYLLSHKPNHLFTNLIIEHYHCNNNPSIKKILDFYAVFRYIRLFPYIGSKTPNNTDRDPIDSFLPYVRTVENQFYRESNCILFEKIGRL